MKRNGKKTQRTFKPGELKRLLGIPDHDTRKENGPGYCKRVAALVERNLRAGKYDGKLGGLLRRKAAYYVNWYRWRAKNDLKREAA